MSATEVGIEILNLRTWDVASSIAIQFDGKIVVAGGTGINPSGDGDIVVVRYNTDGSFDKDFGKVGFVTSSFDTYDIANCVVLQPDGKILAAGSSGSNGSGGSDIVMVRYNSDGSLDSSFGTDGNVTTHLGNNGDIATGMALQSDGKILVVDGWSGSSDFVLLRYNANGTVDTTFGASHNGVVMTDFSGSYDVASDVLVLNNGKIILAGVSSADGSSGGSDFAMVCYNSDGTLDTGFGINGKVVTDIGHNDDLTGVTLDKSGNILLAGYTHNSPGAAADFALARYSSLGILDTSFGTGGKTITDLGGEDRASCVIVLDSGAIMVSGSTGVAGNSGDGDYALVRYSDQGLPDTGFGVNGKVITNLNAGDFATSLAVQTDGNIIMAGYTANYANGSGNIGLVSYNSDGSLNTTFGSTDLCSTITNGRMIFLNFGELLDSANLHLPTTGSFQAQIAGQAATVSAVTINSGNSNYVNISLSSNIAPGVVTRLSYTDPSAGNDEKAIQDIAGNDADSFSVATFVISSKYCGTLFDKNGDGAYDYMQILDLWTDQQGILQSENTMYRIVAKSGDTYTAQYNLRLAFGSSYDEHGRPLILIDDNRESVITWQTKSGDGVVATTPMSIYIKDGNGDELQVDGFFRFIDTNDDINLTPDLIDVVYQNPGNPLQYLHYATMEVSGYSYDSISKPIGVNGFITDMINPDQDCFDFTLVGGLTAPTSIALPSGSFGPDLQAPMFNSASISGNVIIMSYNEILDSGHTPASNAFTVRVNGAAVPVLASIVSGNKVGLLIPVSPGQNDSVAVSYTDPTLSVNDVNALQDINGNDAASLTNISVSNGSSSGGSGLIVSQVSTDHGNTVPGDYVFKAGELIVASVIMNQPVIVTGSPQLEIMIGTPGSYHTGLAGYQGLSSGNILQFSYMPKPEDVGQMTYGNIVLPAGSTLTTTGGIPLTSQAVNNGDIVESSWLYAPPTTVGTSGNDWIAPAAGTDVGDAAKLTAALSGLNAGSGGNRDLLVIDIVDISGTQKMSASWHGNVLVDNIGGRIFSIINESGTVNFYEGQGASAQLVKTLYTQADGGFERLYLHLTDADGNILKSDDLMLVKGVFPDLFRNQERIEGSEFSDTITLSSNPSMTQLISPRSGNDTIWGSDNSESCIVGQGNKLVNLNGGNDEFFWYGTGSSTLDGGSGTDTLNLETDKGQLPSGTISYSLAMDGILHVYAGNSQVAFIEQAGSGDTWDYRITRSSESSTNDIVATIKSIENIYVSTQSGSVPVTLDSSMFIHFNPTGTSGNDSLTGDSGDNSINGGAGDDTLLGMGGDDQLTGGAGKDVLDGGAGTFDWADYSDHDGNLSVVMNGSGDATVYVNGVAEDTISNIENIWGGSGNDSLTGDGGGNLLHARGGNDTLAGGDGDDQLRGDVGNDVLDGGAGTDWADYREKTVPVSVTLNGSSDVTVYVNGIGEDTIRNIENVWGGSGNDSLTGDGNANILDGQGGNDTLKGGAGHDMLDGGDGQDWADYSDKSESVGVTLNGSVNAQVSVGGVYEETICNIENIIGGSGNDSLTGDSLANRFVGGPGHDTIDGGAGIDTVDYSNGTSAPLSVTLNGSNDASVTFGGTTEQDKIRNIENVFGGSGNDTINGDDLANVLRGSDGDDSIFGAAGNDTLRGGAGNNTLDGGDGIDTADYSVKTGAVVVTLNGSTEAQVTIGGSGEVDTIRNIENLVSGSGNDTLTGDGGANTIDGGSGNDSIFGSGGNDLLLGNLGNDTLKGGAGNDTLDGGEGFDCADYSDKSGAVAVTLNTSMNAQVSVGGVAEDTIRNIDFVIGGSGNDSLTGDYFDNRLKGGLGSDTLDGGSGNDTADYTDKTLAVTVTLNGAVNAQVTFSASTELDTVRNIEFVFGGTGNDSLTGDSLANQLRGNDGDDFLVGGAGNDTLRGGVGHDVLDGGVGADFADYSDKSASQAVSVTLNGTSDATVYVNGATEDTVRNIENLTGGQANDTLTGDTLDNVIQGGLGNDILDGGAGADTLNGGSGDDVIRGGTGADTVQFSGKYSEYTVAYDANASTFTVADKVSGRDGSDVVSAVENIQFSDVSKTSAGLIDKIAPGAGTGKLTLNFGGADYALSAALQSDGRILMAGASNVHIALARLNVDGSLDTSFSGDGQVTSVFGAQSYGFDVASLSSGKVLVAGNSDGNFLLVRYNSDGSLDPLFGDAGKAVTHVGYSDKSGNLALQTSDGKILLASTTFESSDSGDLVLIRYTANGILDTSFSGDGILTANFGHDEQGGFVTVQTDGKILLSGNSSIGDGSADFAIARYNIDGSPDTGFGSGGMVTTDFGGRDESYAAPAIQADGKILVVGQSNGDIALARYNPDGTLDTNFSSDGKVTTDLGGNDYGWNVKVLADGKILVAGNSNADQGNLLNLNESSFTGNSDFLLLRYNADGSLDTSFGNRGWVSTDFGGVDFASSMVVQNDGKIVLTGTSNGDFAVARYNANGTLDTSFGVPAMFANDRDGNHVYSSGDTFTMTFTEPVNVDLMLNAEAYMQAGKSLGNANGVALNPVNGYASQFFVTLASDVNVVPGDTFAIPKESVIDAAGNMAATDVTFTMPGLSANELPVWAEFVVPAGQGYAPGQYVSIDLTAHATDANGDTINYFAEIGVLNGNVFTQIPGTRDLSLTATADGHLKGGFQLWDLSQPGNYTIRVFADDNVLDGISGPCRDVPVTVSRVSVTGPYTLIPDTNSADHLLYTFNAGSMVVGRLFDNNSDQQLDHMSLSSYWIDNSSQIHSNINNYKLVWSDSTHWTAYGVYAVTFGASYDSNGRPTTMAIDGDYQMPVVWKTQVVDGVLATVDMSFTNNADAHVSATLYVLDTNADGYPDHVRYTEGVGHDALTSYLSSENWVFDGQGHALTVNLVMQDSIMAEDIFSGIVTTGPMSKFISLPPVTNDAPGLDASRSPSLHDIVTDSMSNTGTSVADIVVDGSISDNNQAPVEAIGVTGVDNTHGIWQYKVGSGIWTAFDFTTHTGTVLLLGSTDLVRFVPAAGYDGTVLAGLTFRAWDMSVGTEGSYLSLSGSVGNWGSLSETADTASIRVTAPVNNPPVLTVDNARVELAENAAAGPIAGAHANASDNDGDTLTFSLVMPPNDGRGHSLFSINSTTGQVSLTEEGHAAIDDELAAKSYMVTVNVSDGHAGHEQTVNITVDISPVNDTPTFRAGSGKVITDIDSRHDDDQGYSVVTQSDGKILVAGGSRNGYDSHFALVRYNIDGSLDTSFGGDGQITTDFGESANGVVLQPDGKILAAGISGVDFAIARFNVDGSFDTSFDGDGMVTRISASTNFCYSVTLQSDGKILVAGEYYSDFALLRFNSDGSFDSGFGRNGEVITNFYPEDDYGSGSSDHGRCVSVQPDGKILVAGYLIRYDGKWNGSDFALARYNSDGSLDSMVTTGIGSGYGSNEDFCYSMVLQSDGKILLAGSSNFGGDSTSVGFAYAALVRFNTDGSLDTSFDGDGKVITNFGSTDFGQSGRSITIQSDGKILVAGSAGFNNSDFALARYNPNGSLDTSFDGDGIVTTDLGSSDYGYSVTVQSDGKILIAGYTGSGLHNLDLALVRYNSDGSLDNSFGKSVNTLDGIAVYVENSGPVVLDSNVQVYDAELFANGSYAGATLDLVRHYGANVDDHFSAKSGGTLGPLTTNSILTVSGVAIGSVANTGGHLQLTFNDNATQALVNEVMQQLTYSNSSDVPPVSVQIDWTFSDGNTTTQGSGGAQSVAGSTIVQITPVNDDPVGIPIISGNAMQGMTLTAVTSGISDADGLGEFGYQWMANGENIINATRSSYVLTESEVGKTITVNVGYTDGQGTSESVVSEATSAVVNVNDAPTVSSALTSDADEGDTSYSLDLLSGASDPDAGDRPSVTGVTYRVGGVLTANNGQEVPSGLSMTGSMLTVDPTNAAFNSLGVGAHKTIVASYTITDGHGGTVSQTETITITGTNDAPTVASVLTSSADEGAGSYNLNLLNGAVDPDTGDILGICGVIYKVNGVATGNSGHDVAAGLSLTGSTLTVDPTNAVFNPLAAGVQKTIEVNYTVADSHGGTVSQTETITITGMNDAPISTNDVVTIFDNANKVLETTDFGIYQDPDGSTLNHVKINNLPSIGHLEYHTEGTDWTAVTQGQEFSAADIAAGYLRFVPVTAMDPTSIEFQVSDGSLYSEATYTLAIYVEHVATLDSGAGQQVQDAGGQTIYTADIPDGMSIVSQDVAGSGAGLTDQISAFADQLVSDAPAYQEVHDVINAYVAGLSGDQDAVRVRALTFGADASFDISTPVVVHGDSSGQEALVIDASALPHGTVLDLHDIEFAIIIGPSHIEGGSGSNIVIADGAAQYIVLGPEDDTIHGGAGDDTVGSLGGNDLLFGDDGNDLVTGGNDNDTLTGGAGNDTIRGDAGDDTVVFSGNFADYHISYDHDTAVYTITDTVDGRDGTDIVSTVEHFQFLDGTKTDILVPQLVSVTPVDGADGVRASSNIVLKFSEDIQIGGGIISIHRGSATGDVVDSFNAATSPRITVSGDTVTIDPISKLDPNTHYFVTIAGETIRDLSGNSYAGTDTYDFSTGAAVHDFEGSVTYWKSGAAIAGTTTRMTDSYSEQTNIVSGSDGHYQYTGIDDGSYTLDAIRSINSGDGNAVKANDALAALKIAYGINPNGTGGGDVSAYQFLAADVDRNGRVQAADALNILKMAYNMGSAPQKEWIIVPESVGSETMNRNSVIWPTGEFDVTIDQNQHLDLVGILKGDVNGSWAG